MSALRVCDVQQTQCQVSDSSLPDFLTYKATGSKARSTCSLACKCSFVPPGAVMKHKCEGGKEEVSKDGWSARFFNKIGAYSYIHQRSVNMLTFQVLSKLSRTISSSSAVFQARTVWS